MASLSPSSVVNVPLISHPMNWLIVWTVLLFFGMAAHLLHKAVTAPAQTTTTQKTGS